MRPVRTCWSVAVRGTVVLLALVCALAGAASAEAATNIFTTIGITREDTRANAQIRGPYAFKGEDMPPSRTVGPAPDDEVDDVPVRMPDTTGNVANLAQYRGQTLDLREEQQKAYTRIHFFGTTADGSGGGAFTLRFDDGSTQTVPDVDWPDWCQSGNAQAHIAIGPGSGRWTPTGEDGAPCSIFHRSADIPAGTKKLVAVTLPPDTDGNQSDARAYLMALTLESGDGSFDMPDLSGALNFPNDKTAPVSEVSFDPPAPDGNDGWYKSPVLVTIDAQDEEGGAGVEQTLWRLSGGQQRTYLGPFELTTAGEYDFEYRAIDGAGNAEGFHSVPLKVDPDAPKTTAAVFPVEPFGTNGWHDGAVTRAPDGERRPGLGRDRHGVPRRRRRLDRLPRRHRRRGGRHPPRGVPLQRRRRERRRARLGRGEGRQDTAGDVRADQRRGARGALRRHGADRADPRRRGGLRRGRDGVPDRRGGRVDALHRRVRPHPGSAATGSTSARATSSATRRTSRRCCCEWRPRSRRPGIRHPPPTRRRSRRSSRSSGAWRPSGRCGAATSACASRARTSSRGPCSCGSSRKVAKRLGLGSRVLAKRSVRCSGGARAAVTLRPGKAVRRALKRADGRIAATLVLRMRGADGTAGDRIAVVLRGN